MGLDGSAEYHGLVRGALPAERHLHRCVFDHAIALSCEHIGRPLATGPYLLRRVRLHHWSGSLVSIQ